jgi:hypothetical protein
MALRAPAPVTRDGDYAEWTREQAEMLRSRDWDALDLEELIEELEWMGESQLDAVESALIRIIEHLLKLEYGARPEPFRGWQLSVTNHRVLADRRLRRSPSVKRKLDLADLYRDGRDMAVASFLVHGEPDPLPPSCPYTLDQLLDRTWWPANRHGLASKPGEG